jgi:hypothetical protein
VRFEGVEELGRRVRVVACGVVGSAAVAAVGVDAERSWVGCWRLAFGVRVERCRNLEEMGCRTC